MNIESIQLLNYRNYRKQNLKLANGVNVFVGENGQGKTNLLEAIYFLTKGNSFRPGTNHSFINFDQEHPTAMIQAIAEDKGLKSLVKIQFSDLKKEFFLNQKKTTGSSLNKNFPSVVFSPESLSVIKDGPEERRTLLDEWLLSYNPKNHKVVQEFKKVLKQKNSHLRSLKKQEISEIEGFRYLSVINELFLEKSLELTMARLAAIESIEPLLETSMKEILGSKVSENVDISVDYFISSVSGKGKTQDEIHNALSIRLKELSQREIESGRSLVGPHKHDIQFLFNHQDSRYYCSQGQQRALILSFKMAQIMYHYRVYQSYPILLLDDVLSELDAEKRANLVQFLKSVQSQIFITTTDMSFPFDFGDQELAVFSVSQGSVERKVKEV